MYSEDYFIGACVLAFIGVIICLVLLCLSADDSSWATYRDHGKTCVTLTRHENHTFSPDKTYVDNWCK